MYLQGSLVFKVSDIKYYKLGPQVTCVVCRLVKYD